MTFPSALPILSVLVWTPTVGAILIACLFSRRRRGVAALFALLTLVLGVWLWLGFGTQGGVRELVPWIPALGVSYELALDGFGSILVVSIPLVALCALLTGMPAELDRRTATLCLLSESALLGLTLARDIFLFLAFLGAGLFVFTLLLSRTRAAKRFFFFQSAGVSVAAGFSLVWYHLAFVQTGFPTAEIARFAGLVTYETFECRMLLVGTVAAACIAPLFPFASWIQESSEATSPSGRVLLLGGWSLASSLILLRIVLPSLPLGRNECVAFAVVLGGLATLYAGLVPYRGAARRSFVPLLVGAQGLVMLGLFSADPAAVAAGRLAVVGIGLGLSALALWADGEDAGEIAPTRFSRGFAAVLVALILWLPDSNGFPSAWVILHSHWERFPVATVLATIGSIAMAIRLVLAFPALARAGAVNGRLKLLGALPLLGWWLVASASIPTPEAPSPVEVSTEIEE